MPPFYLAMTVVPRVTVDAHLRGSSNRQDNGLWNRESAFESLPPSHSFWRNSCPESGPELRQNAEEPLASTHVMGSLIKKRRKRMRKKKHKKMLKRTRWQRRAGK